MNQKGFTGIAVIFLVVVFTGAVGYFILVKKPTQIAIIPSPIPTPVTTTPSQIQASDIAQDKPENILQILAEKIKTDKSYKFRRLAGHSEGFIQGEGDVLFPNKLRERKQGSPYDIFWVTAAEKQAKFKQLNFDNMSVWRLLGGFSNYEAFDQIDDHLETSDFETIQIGNELYLKAYSSAEVKVGEWKKITINQLDDESVELVFSSMLLHIPDILRSTILSSIQKRVIDDEVEITYFADTNKLRGLGVFEASLAVSKTYLKDPGYQKTKFWVKVLVSSRSILKDMEIKVVRDEVDAESRTNEAYKITFVSFGEPIDIQPPL